jgi:hypothetical protein
VLSLSPLLGERILTVSWRGLILRVWHVDALRCPVCHNPMLVVAIVDDAAIVGKFLRQHPDKEILTS